MRPMLAVLISATILGSVWLYLRSESRRTITPAMSPLQVAAGQFDLDITLSFDAGPDRFALDAAQTPSLIVEHLGEAILKRTDMISAGTPVRVEAVPQIQPGKNSFFVRCTPSESETPVARALRIRVWRDGTPVADSTLWSAPGAPCEGVVEVEISP